MYSLLKAIGKSFSDSNRWSETDISNLTVNELFTRFRRLYIVLTHPTIPHPVTLNLDALRDFKLDRAPNAHYDLKFKDFLVALGNLNLPTVNKLPQEGTQHVRYQDAFRAGYTVTAVNEGLSPDAKIPQADKHSLHLSRSDLDFTEFGDYILAAVNGYFHIVEADRKGAWVIDGMRSARHCGLNMLGLLSFKGIGKLKCVPIKESMVYKLDETDGLSRLLGIDVGENLNNYTILLVLGGYLYTQSENVFNQVSDNAIVVRMSNIDLLHRYQTSRQWLDYSSLPFETSTVNDSLINVEDFLSDENLLAYATLSQSFVVLVDNSELYSDKEYVHTPPTPNQVISYSKPSLPLFHAEGRLAHYWSVEEDDRWCLHLPDNQHRRYQYETDRIGAAIAIHDSEDTQQPVDHSQAYYWRIGTDVQLVDAD